MIVVIVIDVVAIDIIGNTIANIMGIKRPFLASVIILVVIGTQAPTTLDPTVCPKP